MENPSTTAVGIFTIKELKSRVAVWGAAIMSLDCEDSFQYTDSIEAFFDMIIKNRISTIFFHKLEYYGEFIVYWLLKNKFIFKKTDKFLKENEFSVLAAGSLGKIYKVSANFMGKLLVFKDSNKILPMSIDEMRKSFSPDIPKLEELKIDINAISIEHILYMNSYCRILRRGVRAAQNAGISALTLGSFAIKEFKKSIGGDRMFRNWFPSIPEELDSDIRNAYHSGLNVINKSIKGKHLHSGVVLDVNSMYPFVMKTKKMPYGDFVRFKGKFDEQKHKGMLYIQFVYVDCELKEGKIPVLEKKNGNGINKNEYVLSTHGTPQLFAIPSPELIFFFKNYDIFYIEYAGGYAWRAANHMFDSFLDKWGGIKEKASKNNDIGIKKLSKSIMNLLAGKFASAPLLTAREPFLLGDVVKYRDITEDFCVASVFLPVGIFINSYARAILHDAIEKNIDRFLYCDTDSLHLLGDSPPDDIIIDHNKIGAWKIEHEFTNAIYLKQKTYAIAGFGWSKFACAGLEEDRKDNLTFADFRLGAQIHGVKTPIHVPGGIALRETTFTILKS